MAANISGKISTVYYLRSMATQRKKKLQEKDETQNNNEEKGVQVLGHLNCIVNVRIACIFSSLLFFTWKMIHGVDNNGVKDDRINREKKKPS